MQSILFRMQETAQQYVEILRDILDIDVTIIDAQRIRVAASGLWKHCASRTGDKAYRGR